MINVEIEARLPDLSKFEIKDSHEKIARNLDLSLKTNFAQGGRPKWLPKKDGSPSFLYKSGRLYESLSFGYSENEAWAGMENGHNPIYGFAQNFGYPPRNLVAREFVMFQQEDVDMAINVLSGDIVSFWNTKGEPVN